MLLKKIKIYSLESTTIISKIFSKSTTKRQRSITKLLKIKRKLRKNNKKKINSNRKAKRKLRKVDHKEKRIDGTELLNSKLNQGDLILFRHGILQLQIHCFFVNLKHSRTQFQFLVIGIKNLNFYKQKEVS